MTEKQIDYLEVDKPIPGQNYVCMSFVSPEKVIEDKNLYYTKKFLNSLNIELPDNKNITEEFESFMYTHKEKLDKEYNDTHDNVTSIRGLKIRGVYDTRKEAEIRAKVLQKLDKSFHVYVGQVGYWLPWDPEPDQVQEQEYYEKELNNLVKSYKDNEMERDMYYQEQINKRKEDIIKENEERKKQNLQETQRENQNMTQDDLIDNIMKGDTHDDLKKQFEKFNQTEN